MLFHGLHNLLKGDGKKHYYIAISAIGLILTHTISTEYSAIFALIYLILNFKLLKNKNVLKKIGINIIFILAITAFFTIPLMEHKINCDYIIFNSTSMRSLPSDVQDSTLKISQLFKDIGEVNGVSFTLGIPLIVLTILGVISFKKIDKDIKDDYITFAIIAAISLTMVTKLFPWIIMPKILTTLQFAWRMLAFFEFALSIICAINLYYFITIVSKQKEKIYNLAFILSIVLITTSMAKINYNYSYEDQKSLTDEEYEQSLYENDKISIWSINRDYLPVKMKTNKLGKSYVDSRTDNVYVLDGDATISDEVKQGLNLEFNIQNYNANTILELPYIYYLGYTATIEQNGNTEEIQTFESDNGMLAVKTYKDIEDAHVSVKYTGTVIEKASYVISVFGILTFIGYVVYFKKKQSKQGNVV